MAADLHPFTPPIQLLPSAASISIDWLAWIKWPCSCLVNWASLWCSPPPPHCISLKSALSICPVFRQTTAWKWEFPLPPHALTHPPPQLLFLLLLSFTQWSKMCMVSPFGNLVDSGKHYNHLYFHNSASTLIPSKLGCRTEEKATTLHREGKALKKSSYSFLTYMLTRFYQLNIFMYILKKKTH